MRIQKKCKEMLPAHAWPIPAQHCCRLSSTRRRRWPKIRCGPADRNRTCIPRLGGMCTIHCATARGVQLKIYLLITPEIIADTAAKNSGRWSTILPQGADVLLVESGCRLMFHKGTPTFYPLSADESSYVPQGDSDLLSAKANASSYIGTMRASFI
jgi:hypothetical protein